MPELHAEDAGSGWKILEYGDPIDPQTDRDLDEARKRLNGSLAVANDYLGKLLTICTALIGGGFAAAKGEAMPKGFALAAVVVLMVAVITCVFGLLPKATPMPAHVNPATLPVFNAIREEAIARKWWCGRIASALFLVALLIAVAGLVFAP